MANDTSSGDLLTAVQEIRAHIERMNKRDRLRTVGAFFKNIITLIPVVLFIYGAWYLAQHWEEIITDIATKSAEQATNFTNDHMNTILEDFQEGQNGAMEDLLNRIPGRAESNSSSSGAS